MTLDLNTAHADLYVSPDLNSVTLSSVQQALPENPERFSFYQVLLGSKSFGSGAHCWHVEVGKSEEWALGVCTESVQRGDQFLMSNVWRVWYSSGVYRADTPGKRYTPLRVNQKPQRIRVYLNWDKGQISFHDPLSETHLYTFEEKFTEKLYPTFANGSLTHSLRILPLTACLTMDYSN